MNIDRAIQAFVEAAVPVFDFAAANIPPPVFIGVECVLDGPRRPIKGVGR